MKKLIEDTLKKDGKWSRTSLTMFSAWIVSIWSYIHFTIKDGFDDMAFGMMLGVALGAKVTDAWSNKMNSNNTPPPPPNV